MIITKDNYLNYLNQKVDVNISFVGGSVMHPDDNVLCNYQDGEWIFKSDEEGWEYKNEAKTWSYPDNDDIYITAIMQTRNT